MAVSLGRSKPPLPTSFMKRDEEREICAMFQAVIAEEGYDYLKAPIKRIGLPDCPTPASYALEKHFYPGVREIIKAVGEVLPESKAEKLKAYTTTEEKMTKFIGIF